MKNIIISFIEGSHGNFLGEIMYGHFVMKYFSNTCVVEKCNWNYATNDNSNYDRPLQIMWNSLYD